MSQTIEIRPDMTMAEIQERIPSAQRALFQRYHVGGCSSCAYQPTDTLAKVCKDHNILDVNEVVDHLSRAGDLDANMGLAPAEVQRMLEAGEPLRFLDVRGPEEIQKAAIPGAEPIDYANSQNYMELPKDTKLVFACKTGARSLDVAAYFKGHGFTSVHSLAGGLDAWREQLDPSLPDYQMDDLPTAN